MDKVNVTDLVRDLLSDMVRMLITHEIQIEAYSLVLQTAQERVTQAGIQWDMDANVRKIQGSAALQAMAEAEYAPFYALLHTKITPENLQVALAAVRRMIDKRNSAGD